MEAKNAKKSDLVKPLTIKGEMLVLNSEDGMFL